MQKKYECFNKSRTDRFWSIAGDLLSYKILSLSMPGTHWDVHSVKKKSCRYKKKSFCVCTYIDMYVCVREMRVQPDDGNAAQCVGEVLSTAGTLVSDSD